MKKNYIIKNIFCIRNNGLAMIEALVAISIIILSIMAPITLLAQSAKYAKYALNKIIATNLAEEQIELMINYKKSLDIYCFNNPNQCNNSYDGFDIFVDNVSSLAMTCDSLIVHDTLINPPCSFDDTSFDYSNVNALPTITKEPSCKIYEEINNTVKCTQGANSKSTPFERYMQIDNIDLMLSGSDIINNTIRLKSMVCINTTGINCINDPSTVTSLYYIYR